MSDPLDTPPAEPGAEPLARPKRTLWQRLGGEGLALSVLVHVFLVLIAIVWVVSTVTDGAGKKDPNAFATGAGGGAGGPKAKEFKTKAVPKNVKSLAKTNTRITSKNANSALAVASLPSMSNPLLSAPATMRVRPSSARARPSTRVARGGTDGSVAERMSDVRAAFCSR